MGKFNSDDHYIYYCGQESLRRSGVALIVNKRVQNAVLGHNLKNDKIISVHFQGKPFNITVIQAYELTSNAEEDEVERFYDDLQDLLVQFSSVAQSCLILCDPMNSSTPGLPVHHQLPDSTMSIESVMPSNHLILCHPLLLLPSIFPSIRVFSSESALLNRWLKYWSFSFSISPSNEHPGLISFRMDWWDLLGVQGTLKSLLQHHSSKASILWCSAFFQRRQWHPTPVLLPGKSMDGGAW